MQAAGSGTATPFAQPAPSSVVDSVATQLTARNFSVTTVDDAEGARSAVLALIPDGAEVHTAKSKTLQDAGIFAELRDAGRCDFLRAKAMAMDRRTQAREIRKLVSAPDIMLGSVEREWREGRTTVVLVRQPIGV